jgi:alkylation response protein AidB-like acyl-CoA dehydrogenase
MDFTLSKEQQDIANAAREFARSEFPKRALEFDREEKFDLSLWKKACELGLVGVFIEKKYGGAGCGFFEHCLITEEFWAAEPGIGEAILASTFGSELISLFGTEEQRQLILPQLVSGNAIIGTAITEPDAGSDVTAAVTTAVRDGNEWLINGFKTFITNGTTAKYILAFCVTNPENASPHKRHSFILVPTETPGYKAVKIRGKMGVRASDTAELSFSDVRVPAENLIGRQGEGFRQLMSFLDRTRVHICAQGVGLSRAALEESLRHTKARRQFGKTLAEFQVTQFKLAEMATRIRAARNLYYEAAWHVDRGKPDPAVIAMAKWYAGETAVYCSNEAVQMHGAYGYVDEYKVQRLYRDAKVLEIYEGAKEVEKIIIARSVLG